MDGKLDDALAGRLVRSVAVQMVHPQYEASSLHRRAGCIYPQVPAWFGQAQRQAVLDSASLVGLNVLSLINSHAAAALQFGIERSFANKTEHVVLYDMGSSSTEVGCLHRPCLGCAPSLCSCTHVADDAWSMGQTCQPTGAACSGCGLNDQSFVLQAALVKYSSFDIREAGKLQTYSQFEVGNALQFESRAPHTIL